MRERIDISSDIGVLIAQLKRLAASRLGKQLGLGPLVFVEPRLAQALIDIDSAVKTWGDKELSEEWDALKRRVLRKAALTGVRKLSEQSMLFIAAAGRERGEEWED
ncbi:MAG: hypothetical protein F7C38_06850 [Desulfurococcales archaeon]|nr:hypothetical protein [Desulfurococcales archaeon]